MVDTAMAHNTQTSGNGACPVITWASALEPDDTANWHDASPEEYQAYLVYWGTVLSCGHERGDHCPCWD